MNIQLMLIQKNYNGSALYTVTWDMSYTSAGQDHIGSYIVKDVCIHNPENIKAGNM